MTSTPRNEEPRNEEPRGDASGAAGGNSAGGGTRKLQDDPRAQLALAKKNQAAGPAGASGGGHAKAAHESSKQGKKEKKVRW